MEWGMTEVLSGWLLAVVSNVFLVGITDSTMSLCRRSYICFLGA